MFQTWMSMCGESVLSHQKSLGRRLNLSFLNEMSNGVHAKVLMRILNRKSISKIKTGMVVSKRYLGDGESEVVQFLEYGHIRVGNSRIRLSSCLDIDNQIVQYPIYEQDHFKNGDFIYFTCGDMFLLVRTDGLDVSMSHRTTGKGNYELNISSLFAEGVVENFGIIRNGSFTDRHGTHLIRKKCLPKSYTDATISPCRSRSTPRYILARLDNSASPEYFEYEMWSDLGVLYRNLKSQNSFKGKSTVWSQVRTNTRHLLDGGYFESMSRYSRKPGVIMVDGIRYMVFDMSKVGDIEKVRSFCHKTYMRFFVNV